MKKILLVLSLIAISLSGCYIRAHDDGYHRGRDHHEGREHHDDRDDRRDERGDHYR